MPLVLNGRLDGALLANVPGGRLDLAASASWIRLRADVLARFGFDLMPTSSVDTYRPYEVQERIFRQRYTTGRVTGIDPRKWLGQTWWRLPVYAAAAVPGTSNHGWGRAVDIASMGGFTSAKYKAVAAVAPAHGWDNNEGRSIAEPWHWTYKPANDSRPGGGAVTPEPVTPRKAPTMHLIRGIEKPEVWITDGVTKRHVRSTLELGELCRITGQDEPLVIGQYACDAIPVHTTAGTVDVVALARAVAAALPAGSALTAAQVQAATEAGVRAVLRAV